MAAALAVLGICARLAPIVEGPPRLFTHFPADDGYLMLTIARNLGTGLGMSTAAGNIPTNGTQPLATLIYAGAFWLVEGARVPGVRLVLLLETLFSLAVAGAIAALGFAILRERPWARDASWLAAGLWLASPVTLPISMNCQETTLAALATVLVALGWIRLADSPTWSRTLALGLGLGLAFLIRNDAVFLVATTCGAHVVLDRATLPRRIAQSVVMGLLAIVIASPWLAFNLSQFGSVVPISGASLMLKGELGMGAARLPAVVAHYLLPVASLPWHREPEPVVAMIGAAVSLAGLAAYARAGLGAGLRQRRLMLFVAVLAVQLCAFYAFVFEAPFHLRRYLLPLSPFLALGLAAGVSSRAWQPAPGARTDRLLGIVAAACLIAGLAWQAFASHRGGLHHTHWEKTQWVQRHVPPEDWVGALQSGTLGFFHDRTVNLDGKVNPQALEALRTGRLSAYVLQSPIRWLVDWPRIASLGEGHPAMRQEFELVERRRPYLAVYQRRSAETGSEPGS